MMSTELWKAEAERLYELHKDEPDRYAIIARELKEGGFFPDKEHHSAREAVRGHFRRRGECSTPREETPPATKESFEYRGDGSVVSTKFITLRDGEEMTPELLLKAHGLAPEKWDVHSYINNLWNSQLEGGHLQVSYQSKLFAKPKEPRLSLEAIDKHFLTLDRQDFKLPAYKPAVEAPFMVEVNVADLHVGRLCWHGNTPENFDYKIARETYYQIIADIVGQIKDMPIEYITFVWANDFFNADTIDNTTTAGTRQEVDVRWQKLFNVGCEMLVRGVEALAEIAPLRTFYTPSNHDEVNGYHALKFMEAWFRQTPRITVDISAQPRKYQLFGNTLLGYCHGHKEETRATREKASRLASAMPIEASELWSKSKYREFHTAHLHSEHMIQEINGVIVRRISSPTAVDTWHNESGYVGSVRKAQAFVYDKEWGLMRVINAPARIVTQKATTELGGVAT